MARARDASPEMLHSLNLINEGQIPELSKNAFVETPAVATPTPILIPRLSPT